ncbi:hypothetical protein [Salinisphaera hydrothermalis]|uniref:Uncharacterized protein n=1 Tax=Salinisphaera hydrothermalis (strain C41B8) TaxID=1304275 RepID=A0A084IN18_SALHC|nr:hypothetical protein [Salinisphaera hydrothermalis]KEZ78102.1 hypothetical protein C41B8_05942 [Salinisphaera hydrothermalis C41B8]
MRPWPPRFVLPEAGVPVRLPPAEPEAALRALPDEVDGLLPAELVEGEAAEELDVLERGPEVLLAPADGLLPALLLLAVAALVEAAPEAAVALCLPLSDVLGPLELVVDADPDEDEAEPLLDAALLPVFCAPDDLLGPLPVSEALFVPAPLADFVVPDSPLLALDLSAPAVLLGPDCEAALDFPPFDDDALDPDAVWRSEPAPELALVDWADPADEASDFPASLVLSLGGAADSDGLLLALDWLLSSDGAEDLARSALFWSRLS